jgi:predicted phage-related endonuclease
MIERVNVTTKDDWVSWRRDWLGASEIPIVCGVETWGSQAELYAEKKGLRPPKVDNAAMKRGRWGEASVFQALAEERPEWKIVRAWVHVRDTERRIACTPDGFAERPDSDGPGIIQAKVIARSVFRQRWLDDPTDNITGPATPPDQYRLQTLCEMMLNEVSWGVLAVLINGEYDWTLRLFDIDRDAVLEDRIYYNADVFWRDYLDAGIMPPFEPLRDEALVRALHPLDNGSEIDLSGDNRALVLVEDLKHTQSSLKHLEKQERGIKTELCAKLGDYSYGRLADGRRLSWRHQHRKAHSVKASDFRVFRVLSAQQDD